jgi:hypothetical protein
MEVENEESQRPLWTVVPLMMMMMMTSLSGLYCKRNITMSCTVHISYNYTLVNARSHSALPFRRGFRSSAVCCVAGYFTDTHWCCRSVFGGGEEGFLKDAVYKNIRTQTKNCNKKFWAAWSALVKKQQLRLCEISDASCGWSWTPMVHAFNMYVTVRLPRPLNSEAPNAEMFAV